VWCLILLLSQSQCAALQDVLRYPVICADGYTYERAAIEAWLARSDRSPMTNHKLAHADLVPNRALRGVIAAMSGR